MRASALCVRRLSSLVAAALAAVATLAAVAATARAQEGPRIASAPVEWFDLGHSPLALSGPARRGSYLASVGRRAIAMGTEDGRFELWSWPVKWLHDLELSFRVPKYTAPLAGRDLAHAVTVRPEGVTITYAHETFTVRQHVFAALDLPATIMLLEVDAVRPMEIVVEFSPDIHFAWPASLGGQYIAWNADARAFLFSESRRQVNAFLGSPAITRASDVPAHQLAAARPQFVIGVGAEGDRYTEPRLGEPPGRGINLRQAYIPLVLAGGEMPRDSARALYDRLSAPGAARREWARRVAHADSLERGTMRVITPDTLLNRAFAWAKVNLDESLACNPELGCGLVAGYGLSGAASDRPGFGWYFGGDAAINSFAMTAVGQRELVREGLFRFFARYQRADGKITHEVSQGAAKIDWFNAYPYAYYHGDTTPFWILAFGEYWRQSADTALVRELWPNLRRAYTWSRSADSDGDGLMENPIAGAGALEVGDLQEGIVSDVYLSGVWVAALERFARMAEVMREPRLAAEARAVRTRAVATMEAKLWLPAPRHYAFALLERGAVNENLTAWPATAMAFDVLDPVRGAEMAARLAGSEIMTDWGARPLSARSALFDPLHYNNGAVWPFVTGWTALAQYRYHNPHAGKFALDAIARTGFDEALGRNPEVISGRVYKSLDTSVPHQFFATSMVITPLVRGLLGLEVDAPAGLVTVAPHLPPAWDSVRVEHLAVGATRLTVLLRREQGMLVLHATRDRDAAGPPLRVAFTPALPLGATQVRAARDVAAPGTPRTPTDFPGARIAGDTATLGASATVVVRWNGGWEADAPSHRPKIGDRSGSVRIVRERLEGERYVLTLEGPESSEHRVRLRAPDVPSGRFTIRGAADAPAHPLPAPGDDGWRAIPVAFPSSRANDDGYVTVDLVVQR